MQNRAVKRWLTATLAMLTLMGAVACSKTPSGTEEGTGTEEESATMPATEPSEETDGEGTVDTEPTQTTPSTETEEEDTDMPEEPEVFAPDPEHAVPKYDALLSDLDSFPISFKYGSKKYAGFAGFRLESETYTEVDRGVESTLLLRHPDISAVFKLVATVYPQESAYEYVIYITNDTDENTEVISNLCYTITFAGESPVISGIKGDGGPDGYMPYEYDLEKRPRYADQSTSGRPSHGVFPYYNLSYGNGGTFIAIGWPGTWYASYAYDRNEKVTTLRAGQGEVKTYVAPGETLRMPLMGFVEYEGLTADEQVNAWRHYYIQDVMRKIDGELPKTYAGVSSMSQGLTTQKVLQMLRMYKNKGIDLDVVWLDAGWYTGVNGEPVAWTSTGSLDMDYSRFPDGMAEIGQYAEENDIMFMLWFEPENMRLDKDAFLAAQPDFKEEWLLGTLAEGSWLQSNLIDLGNEECRAWLFNKICKVIDTAGVTAYRQDFNNDPAPAWAKHDAQTPNRTGMTENQYVQGYLALWDALIEKYGFFVDSCASGGGRNDLESMKRGVPLHYSDWYDGNHEDYDMKGKNTQALFQWFPYFKNEVYQNTLYKFRVNYAPFSLLKVESVYSKDTDWNLINQVYDEYDLIRSYFYSDYYMLTEWTKDKDRWDARMFFDAESGEGFASIACQEGASDLSNTVCLKGLDADKQYTVTDLDGLVNMTASGKELMEKGINITVPEKPYCAILLIKPAA